MKTDSEQMDQVRDLMKSFSTAMLVTRGLDDMLHARPMAVADVGEGLDLWFFSADHSVKTQEIEHDTRAHVICQKDHSAYLSMSGTTSLVRDRQKISEMWKEAFRVWFPGGKEDPNIVLIRFHASHAEFWDNTGFNRIAYLWEAAKAYVTGDKPALPQDSHGVVTTV